MSMPICLLSLILYAFAFIHHNIIVLRILFVQCSISSLVTLNHCKYITINLSINHRRQQWWRSNPWIAIALPHDSSWRRTFWFWLSWLASCAGRDSSSWCRIQRYVRNRRDAGCIAGRILRIISAIDRSIDHRIVARYWSHKTQSSYSSSFFFTNQQQSYFTLFGCYWSTSSLLVNTFPTHNILLLPPTE